MLTPGRGDCIKVGVQRLACAHPSVYLAMQPSPALGQAVPPVRWARVQHRAWSLSWDLQCPPMWKGLSRAGPEGFSSPPNPRSCCPGSGARAPPTDHRSSPRSGARRFHTQSHTVFVPLFLIFFKLKQQSGNCPNPTGIRPWAVLSSKKYIFFFFFFKQHQKQIHSPC